MQRMGTVEAVANVLGIGDLQERVAAFSRPGFLQPVGVDEVLGAGVWINPRLRKTYGQAFPNSRPMCIQLSRRLLRNASEQDKRDVFLHEVAHLVAGDEAGHGSKFRTVCRGLGTARTAPSGDLPSMPEDRKVVARCRQCGHKFRAYRRLGRRKREASAAGLLTHRDCGGHVVVN